MSKKKTRRLQKAVFLLEEIFSLNEEILYFEIKVAVNAYLAALSKKRLAALIAAAENTGYSDSLSDKNGTHTLLLLAEHVLTRALEEHLATSHTRDDVRERFFLEPPSLR